MMPIKPIPRTTRGGVRYADAAATSTMAIPEARPGYTMLKPIQSARPQSSLKAAVARSGSPYTFKPISDEHQQRHHGAPSPAFDYRKATPSPALTATTVDSSESYASSFSMLDSSSRSLLSASPTPSATGIISPLGAGSPFVEKQALFCRPVSNRLESPPPTSSLAAALGRKTPDSSRKSPFARNNDDDFVRKSRHKSEICMNWQKGKPCPFGANCAYAHGEEELQMTKLMDLHRAGLIDVETYRTLPCLTWVKTGSW
jgi:hypothetical protein